MPRAGIKSTTFYPDEESIAILDGIPKGERSESINWALKAMFTNEQAVPVQSEPVEEDIFSLFRVTQ